MLQDARRLTVCSLVVAYPRASAARRAATDGAARAWASAGAMREKAEREAIYFSENVEDGGEDGGRGRGEDA